MCVKIETETIEMLIDVESKAHRRPPDGLWYQQPPLLKWLNSNPGMDMQSHAQ